MTIRNGKRVTNSPPYKLANHSLSLSPYCHVTKSDRRIYPTAFLGRIHPASRLMDDLDDNHSLFAQRLLAKRYQGRKEEASQRECKTSPSRLHHRDSSSPGKLN